MKRFVVVLLAFLVPLVSACHAEPLPTERDAGIDVHPLPDAGSQEPPAQHEYGAAYGPIPPPGPPGTIPVSQGQTSLAAWLFIDAGGINYPIDGGGISNGTVQPVALSPGTAGQVLQTNDGGAGWVTSYVGVYPVAVPNIVAIGDSTGKGSNGLYTGLVGGWPSAFVEQLRQWRGDFEMVASQPAIPETAAGSSVVWNEGHPGDTIADLSSGWSGWRSSAAFGGSVNIAILSAGVNDVIGGRSAVQMETDYQTLRANVLGTDPSALIVDMCFAPFVAGTTVAGNLATDNATQLTFCSWLQNTWVPAHSTTDVWSGCMQSVTPGDRLPDGVHYTQQGYAGVGNCVAQQFQSLLGVPRGPTQLPPSGFSYRQPWASEQIVTASTDALTATSHAGFNPGAGSFTLAFDVYPTSLPSGTSTLANYGSYAVNNFYGVLWSPANGLCVYWENTAATVCNAAAGGTFAVDALTVGKWHRVVVMADAAHCEVGLYVNGKLAGLGAVTNSDGGAGCAWTNTQQAFTLGKESVFGQGIPGYYSRVWAAKAVVAEPGGVGALRAAEADYYLGQGIDTGQASASFTLNGLLSDDVYAPGAPNPSFVAAGGATAVSAWPGGTPLRPWELDGRSLPGYLYDPAGVSRVAVTSGATTVDNASVVDIATGSATQWFAGNSSTNLGQMQGLTLKMFNGATQVAQLASGAGDYLYEGTSQTTQLIPGELQTTSGTLTLNGNAGLVCQVNGSNVCSLDKVSGDYVSLGPNASGSGHVRTDNNSTAVSARNVGGTVDIGLIGSDSSNNVQVGDPAHADGMNFKIDGAGSFGWYDSSLIAVLNSSLFYGASGGGIGFGQAADPWGTSYIAGPGVGGYTAFAASAGTHNTQDGIKYSQIVEGRLSSYSSANFNSYTLSAAHHGFSYSCRVNARVVTQGLGGGCAFWGSGQGVPDITYRTNFSWSAYCTASNTCTHTGAGFYDSVDTTSAGTTQSGTSPTNPVLFFGGLTVSGLTVTIQWQYVTDSGGACTNPPVVDVVSDCWFHDN